MSSWLIGVVGVVYLFTALSFWLEGQKGMAITFIGYALANAGLIAATKGV